MKRYISLQELDQKRKAFIRKEMSSASYVNSSTDLSNIEDLARLLDKVQEQWGVFGMAKALQAAGAYPRPGQDWYTEERPEAFMVVSPHDGETMTLKELLEKPISYSSEHAPAKSEVSHIQIQYNKERGAYEVTIISHKGDRLAFSPKIERKDAYNLANNLADDYDVPLKGLPDTPAKEYTP